jgi:hypothetical protein
MSPTQSASAAPAGHWVAERPESGLARGSYAWPAWAIGLAGAAVVLLVLLLLGRRWRRGH